MRASAPCNNSYHFGLFEARPASGELLRQGIPVRIQDQAFRVLCLLLERSGEVVTRQDLRQMLWPEDTFVDFDGSLNAILKKLRAALGDDSENPRFIETIPKRGYRFLAPVDLETSARKPTAGTTPIGEVRPAPRRALWVSLGVFFIAVAGILVFILRTTQHNQQRLGRIMLIVLPLNNYSGDAQQEYLANGITEEIIAQLGSLDPQHLGVIARTSAMHYKNTQNNTAQICHEIGADYLLEGSIRRSGDRIRITAQLIQSSDQSHLWANSYERELGDILKVENEIASSVAQEIRPALSQQLDQRLAPVGQTNPEAHDAYLRGLEGWNLRTREGFQQAIAEYSRAVELDGSYATAFAGLARVYSLAPVFAGVPPGEAAPKAVEAATRALSLDEKLADAHSALGFVKSHYEYDWPAAASEFRRAIELEPNNAYAHLFYSNSYLSPFGRHAEAINEMKKAMELDPLSPIMQSFAGVTFRWARDYKASLAQFQKVNLLNPNFALNHERMSQLLAIVGNYDAAISEESKARLLAGEKQVQVIAKMDALRQMLAAEGARGYWEQELKLSQDNENPPEAYVHSFGLAIIYANLGDKDKSFDNLENAFEERDTHMTELAIEPQFDTLRSDSRFGVLARRVGLLTH